MKLRSSVCFAFPPTHLTDSRSGIELLCFSGILSTSTSKSVVRRWLKKIKERKGVGGQGRDKSLWLSLHTMVLIWISPYIADHQSEWCPDEVLFLWFHTWIPKTPGIHFPLFVFAFKVIWNGTWWNEETERSTGPNARCCLPNFSPCQRAFKLTAN